MERKSSASRVATAFGYGQGPKTLRVFDVETGTIRLFDLPVPSPPPGSTPPAPTGYEGGIASLAFVDDSTLYTAGHGGIRRWNIEAGTHELVRDDGPRGFTYMAVSRNGRAAVTMHMPFGDWSACPSPEWLDLTTGAVTPLPQLGDCPPDVVPALVGSVVLLSDFVRRWLFWGGGRRGGGDREDVAAAGATPLRSCERSAAARTT